VSIDDLKALAKRSTCWTNWEYEMLCLTREASE